VLGGIGPVDPVGYGINLWRSDLQWELTEPLNPKTRRGKERRLISIQNFEQIDEPLFFRTEDENIFLSQHYLARFSVPLLGRTFRKIRNV
jgi:hypothetical protein